MKLLTVQQVGVMLSCAKSTVYELVSRGEIPAFKIGVRGGGIRIDEADVRAYLESHRMHGKPVRAPVPRVKLNHIKL